MNFKKVSLLSFMTVLLLFIISIIFYEVSTEFKIKNVISNINFLSFVLVFPLFYLTVILYDIDARNLLRSKVLYYILMVLSIGYFVYYFIFDPWAGTIAIYFALSALLHIIVMTIINRYKLNDSIPIKREWILLGSWIGLILLFFIVTSNNK